MDRRWVVRDSQKLSLGDGARFLAPGVRELAPSIPGFEWVPVEGWG